MTEDGARTTVSYRQDEWDRMGETGPVADGRATVATRYVLEPGAIRRSDDIVLDEGAGPATIDLEFPVFSRGATMDGAVIRFAQGEVTSFEATGLTCAPTEAFDPATYASPVGAFRTLIRCRGEVRDRINLSWRIGFAPR